MVSHAVPSALRSLTSVFGMGTGVASLLLSPEKKSKYIKLIQSNESKSERQKKTQRKEVIKPHDLLVSVS